MDNLPASRGADAETRRALALDALAAILPIDRLAALLTDDVATLRHLAREGMGENTLRVLASDLAYLEAWAQAAFGSPLPWPASEGMALKFVAHHLWDRVERETDARHGMPEDVVDRLRGADMLRADGPHAPATVRRRLASWATLHRWRGLEGPFESPRPARRPAARVSPTRDRAVLLVAFASGGRRRSEIAGLRVEQLHEEPPVPGEGGAPLPCLSIALRRTKTGKAEDDARVWLIGPPVAALRDWLARAQIRNGPIFRGVDRWGGLERRALTPQAVALILKRRCVRAGLDPREFSAHGLRSGYLTEAARYYNEAERRLGRAARLAV